MFKSENKFSQIKKRQTGFKLKLVNKKLETGFNLSKLNLVLMLRVTVTASIASHSALFQGFDPGWSAS